MSKLVIDVVIDGTSASFVKEVIHTFIPGGDYTGVRVSSIVPFLCNVAEGITDSQTKVNSLFVFVGYGNQVTKGNDTLNELLVAQSVMAINQLNFLSPSIAFNTSNAVSSFSIGAGGNVMVIGQNMLSTPIDVIADLSVGVASLSTLADLQNSVIKLVVEYEPIKISDKSYLAVTRMEKTL